MSQSHATHNQDQYNQNATLHDQLELKDSTLFLAYRDLPEILKKHLTPEEKDFRYLDYGCGSGLSTQIYSQELTSLGHKPEIHALDINTANLELAQKRLPQAQFHLIKPGEALPHLGHFDLISCNFVLVEMKQKEMQEILIHLQSLLKKDGILIVTNCAKTTYRPDQRWLSFDNNFPENKPQQIEGKLKYQEDQPIKVRLKLPGNLEYTFFDFFHSGRAYRESYQRAQLQLLSTYKPLGKDSDQRAWQTEKEKACYKIHVLRKARMVLALDRDYRLEAYPRGFGVESYLFYKDQQIGKASYVSDGVDVGCITAMEIKGDEHANHLLTENKTLGHAFVKFFLKYPALVRKLEFRFMIDPSPNLQKVLEDYHLVANQTTKTNILLRNEVKLAPLSDKELKLEGLEFKRGLSKAEQAEVLTFLRNPDNGAVWQANLSADRLNLLIQHADCFAAFKEGRLIAFCRVVSDKEHFASLWDMVVAKPYQNQGIGTALLRQVFSDPVLAKLPHWAIFSDTAAKLYAKFGFDIVDSKVNPHFLIKIKEQERAPEYMPDLIKAVAGLPLDLHLEADQSLAYLFGEQGKRAELAKFWGKIG